MAEDSIDEINKLVHEVVMNLEIHKVDLFLVLKRGIIRYSPNFIKREEKSQKIKAKNY